jgi:Flp pilus assembly pilin Flp
LKYLKACGAAADIPVMVGHRIHQRGANLIETGVVLALIVGVVIASSTLLTTQLTSTISTAAGGFDLASAGSGSGDLGVDSGSNDGDLGVDSGSNDYASVDQDVPAGEGALPPVDQISTPPPTIAPNGRGKNKNR